MRKNRKKVLITLASILVLLIVVGVSYAYTIADMTGINKTQTDIRTLVLGPGEYNDIPMNCSNIVPGDQCTKEFTVSNPNTNQSMIFNIYMKNTINQFYSDLNDFVFTLKNKNTGEVYVTQRKVPGTDDGKQYIYYNFEVPANTTVELQFVIDYIFLEDKDQSSFQGKEFDTVFGADEVEFEGPFPCGTGSNDPCPEPGDEIPRGGSSTSSESHLVSCASRLGMTGDNSEIVDNCDEKLNVITYVENNNYYTKEIDNPYCKESTDITYACRPGNRIYGETVAIHHDIYYADSEKYSTGKNERYVTYCTPFRDGDTKKIMYCSKKNYKDCKIVDRTTCSYQNAIIDLGYSSIKKQKFVKNFMDTGWNDGGTVTNNWHIKSFCNEAGKITNWSDGGGVYYCDNSKSKLHDWYSTTTSSANELNYTCNAYYENASSPTLASDTYIYRTAGYQSYYNVNDVIRKGYYAFISNKDTIGLTYGVYKKAVCIYKDNKVTCFGYEDKDHEYAKFHELFADGTCKNNGTECTDGYYTCSLISSGGKGGNRYDINCYISGINLPNQEASLYEELSSGNNNIDHMNLASCESIGVYTKCSDWVPSYFEYGDPTTSSSTTPIDSLVYAAMDDEGRKGVCFRHFGMNINAALYCLKINDVETEKEHLQQIFSTYGSCTSENNDLTCIGGDYGSERCTVYSDGSILCSDSTSPSKQCLVTHDGVVTCGPIDQ